MTTQVFEGAVLRRNSIINLVGLVSPLLIAMLAMPLLLNNIGTVRFGVLSLAWVLVGYFSLFDFGLGRANTKFVAELLGTQQTSTIPKLIWTSTTSMLMLGIVGSVVLLLVTPWLTTNVLKIPDDLRNESRLAFSLLATVIPVVIVTSGLNGILEAYQRFDLVNVVRVPVGISSYVGPLIVSLFTNSLLALALSLAVSRLIGGLATLIAVLKVSPIKRQDMLFSKELLISMLRFGGWLTISSLIAPLMLYTDRFFIASMVSVEATTYYTMPYEMVTRLLIIPSALISVVFPAFASAHAQKSLQAPRLYKHTMAQVMLFMIPAVAAVFFFAEPGLAIWLDKSFAVNSTTVAQLLALGVLINSWGLISQAYVQAAGRSDLTAKLHLLEAPLYFIYLSLLLSKYGVNGAALAWLLRVTISAVTLYLLTRRRSHDYGRSLP